MELCQPFIKGINYWPINKAMHWWPSFNRQEVNEDFQRIINSGFQVVRIFLNWEDFQPHPQEISPTALDNLQFCLDSALKHGLQIMPTFFCGHMSGVNWMPYWLLEKEAGNNRFPVYSNGLLKKTKIKNFYREPAVIEAQIFQLQLICSTLKGHKALFAYDLGNESSNCFIPNHREEFLMWLQTMSSIIRDYGKDTLITLGMHAEDLEENRNIWPQDIASCCDFLSMHAYPFYLNWVNDPLDVYILPFLGIITEWLGKKPLLFQEFGAPSISGISPQLKGNLGKLKCSLWTEEEVASYYRKSIELMQKEKFMGGFAWCFADYAPELWDKPPLAENPHERFFGIFRNDGSAKPAVEAFKEKTAQEKTISTTASHPWLSGFDRDNFYKDPKNNLIKLYRKYQQHLLSKDDEL